MATIEINEAVFCQNHTLEVCEDCSTDTREENDSFYGFGSKEREPITCPPVSQNDDGIYVCNAHESGVCHQCFNWKKQIMKLQKAAKNH